MARFAWWELAKHPEWVEQQKDETDLHAIRCIGIPKRVRLIYVPRLWDPPVLTAIELDVRYRATYFDPCTGTEHDLGQAVPDENGRWQPPFPPEVHDWIIVLEVAEV